MANVIINEGTDTLGTPASGDSLYVTGGGQTIDTVVDQSGLANGFVVVEVAKAYTGQFATAGNPFYSEVTTRLVYAAQSGDMYYRGKDGGDATPWVWVCGGGHFHAVTDGTATRFEVSSGTATIEGPFIATTLRVSGSGKAILKDDSSTDPTLLELLEGSQSVSGPQVTTERGGTTFTVKHGTLTIDAGSNTIGTLNCDGGTTILKMCGTITTANLKGAVPDTSQMVQPLTITNTTINMALPNAQAFLDNPLITFTNTPERIMGDGRIV